MGRPSKRTPELIAEICERLSKGEPLAAICRDDHMPDRKSIWNWEQEDPELSPHIARAREEGFDAIALNCLEISDDGRRDYVGADGERIIDHDHIQRAKLRVDTRLKLLAKWDPKRYGDKVQHANAEGGLLPAPEWHVHPVATK